MTLVLMATTTKVTAQGTDLGINVDITQGWPNETSMSVGAGMDLCLRHCCFILVVIKQTAFKTRVRRPHTSMKI